MDGPGDATRISRLSPRDTLWAALSYPTRSTVAQAPLIWQYVARAAHAKSRHFTQILLQTGVVVLGHTAALSIAISWHGPRRGLWVYGCAIALPALFASWAMMFTNYVQHVGCDPASPDNHSRNFLSPLSNLLLFEAGYHTVHHEHSGTHWSRYPELHAARAARIDPRLNEHSILGYCVKVYLLRSGSPEVTIVTSGTAR